MKNILIIATLVVTCLSSCSVSQPFHVTDNAAGKTGEASYNVILGFIRPMSVDVGIAAAAADGGITKVATVDVRVSGGLFTKTYTTVVTGQ
jgi:hypothetical protein|tara:strand:- start:33 stop:305 length:273 start_codon:yes stop_codon:yes gene_type:complete